MWLNAMLYPLAVCYSGYTLVYSYHRSWYSWLIGSLYRCVFVAGFVAMTPQIFLNHKLQSVAAMPWEAMLYKLCVARTRLGSSARARCLACAPGGAMC